jgi:hypothetical protein
MSTDDCVACYIYGFDRHILDISPSLWSKAGLVITSRSY